MCPSASPPVPSDSTATALSTAFAGIFDSTADPRSTTGAVTLRSVLDPGNTGTLVLTRTETSCHRYSKQLHPDLRPLERAFRSSGAAALARPVAQLPAANWATVGSAPLATARSASESLSVDGGDVVYTVTCTDGERQRSRRASRCVGRSARLRCPCLVRSLPRPTACRFEVSWISNLRPCAASGGNSGDGWAGRSIRRARATDHGRLSSAFVTYTLTCGSGERIASRQLTVRR